MQTGSSNSKRMFGAFLLAIVLAGAASQSTAFANYDYEGYGTGNCSLWQKIRSKMTGVYCGYL